MPLPELRPLIDWSPFFSAWELKGTYPKIFEHAEWGSKARELWGDAQKMLDRMLAESVPQARAVYGFFPAGAVGDDVELYSDDSRRHLLATFPMLRSQADMTEREPNRCLADYVAPRDSGQADYLGLFAVSAGFGLEPWLERFAADHDDYSAILAKSLADRLAEALAEWLHRQARAEWGYGRGERLAVEDLIRERYRGIRPAPGYPACPDHTEKGRLFELLEATPRIGLTLTESYAMLPTAAVSGFFFSHPEARYFQVGRIGLDQVLDYKRRKGLDQHTVERWLSPWLDYEPAGEPVVG